MTVRSVLAGWLGLGPPLPADVVSEVSAVVSDLKRANAELQQQVVWLRELREQRRDDG